MRNALEHCINETRIALVFQPSNSGCVFWAPSLKVYRGYSVGVQALIDAWDSTDMLGDFADDFLDRWAAGRKLLF